MLLVQHSAAGSREIPIIKLTSAVAGRTAIFVNTDHVISFSDQAGGCIIRTTSAGNANTIAVTETAETVLKRLEDARRNA